MRGVLYLCLAVCLVFVIALSVFNGSITGRFVPPSPIQDPNVPDVPDVPDGPDIQVETPLEEAFVSPLLDRFVSTNYEEGVISIKQFKDKKRNVAIKSKLVKITPSHVTWEEDKCVDAKTLEQYYIENYRIKTEETICEDNCYDGTCREFKCIDSDGDNVEIMGHVEGVGPEGNIYYREDYCVGKMVREFNCVNDKNQHYDSPCEFGCDSGKCKKRIQEHYGFDSDGPYNWFTSGFITGKDEEHGEFRYDDECYGDVVLEYYYTGDEKNGVGITYIGCFYGCEDGACIVTDESPEFYSICLDHHCVKVEGPGEDLCSIDEDCIDEEGSGRYRAFVREEEGTKKCDLTSQPGLEPCLDDEPVDEILCSDLEGTPCENRRCVGKYVATDDADNCCVGTCLNPVVAALNSFLNNFS